MKAASQCMSRSRPSAAVGGEDRERSRSPKRPPAKRRQREKDEDEEEEEEFQEEEEEEFQGEDFQGKEEGGARAWGDGRWELSRLRDSPSLSPPLCTSRLNMTSADFDFTVRVVRWDDRFYQFHIEATNAGTQRTAATVHLMFNPSVQHRQ